MLFWSWGPWSVSMLNAVSLKCVLAVVVLVMTVIAVWGTQAERAVDTIITVNFLRETLILALQRLAAVQRICQHCMVEAI